MRTHTLFVLFASAVAALAPSCTPSSSSSSDGGAGTDGDTGGGDAGIGDDASSSDGASGDDGGSVGEGGGTCTKPVNFYTAIATVGSATNQTVHLVHVGKTANDWDEDMGVLTLNGNPANVIALARAGSGALVAVVANMMYTVTGLTLGDPTLTLTGGFNGGTITALAYAGGDWLASGTNGEIYCIGPTGTVTELGGVVEGGFPAGLKGTCTAATGGGFNITALASRSTNTSQFYTAVKADNASIQPTASNYWIGSYIGDSPSGLAANATATLIPGKLIALSGATLPSVVRSIRACYNDKGPDGRNGTVLAATWLTD